MQGAEDRDRASTAAAACAARPAIFCTDSLDPSTRYEVWRAHFGALNDVAVAPDSRAGFSALSRSWRLGPMLFTTTRTPARRLLRTRRQVAGDGIDHWKIRVLRSGRTVTIEGDRVHVVGPGQLYFGTFGDAYLDDWTDGEWVGLIVPRDMLPGLAAGLAAQGAGAVPGVRAAVLADYLLSLSDRLEAATEADLPVLADATRGLVAACLLSDRAPAAMREGDVTGMMRLRVERVIRDNIASARLDPERIAELAGVSRSALYRMFAAEGGVASYLRETRLRHIHADLADPATALEPVGRIAERWGFYSTASFNRAFRRSFGATPGEVRAGALGPAAGLPDPLPLPAPGSVQFLDLIRAGAAR